MMALACASLFLLNRCFCTVQMELLLLFVSMEVIRLMTTGKFHRPR